MEKRDCESQTPTQLSHFAQVLSQAGITQDVEAFDYKGSGTEEDPYIVEWIPQDPRNPMHYSTAKRWAITGIVAIATLAVALVSSAYSGGAKEVIEEFGCSQEVFTLGIGESWERHCLSTSKANNMQYVHSCLFQRPKSSVSPEACTTYLHIQFLVPFEIGMRAIFAPV